MIEAAPAPTDLENARELLERARAWEEEPLTPEAVRDLEATVSRVISMGAGLQDAWAGCTGNGSVWETEAYLSRIEAIESMAFAAADILTLAEKALVHKSENQAERAAEVRKHLDAVKELAGKAQALSQWLNREQPPFNEEMIERSRESLDRNEGESIGEVIVCMECGGNGVTE